jgi:hypothetical protein
MRADGRPAGTAMSGTAMSGTAMSGTAIPRPLEV